MSRYIKVEDMRAIFCQSNSLTQAWNGFDMLPSIDIEPKRGKWLERNSGFTKWIRCSVCDHKFYQGTKTNFCPNCGADMRAKEGE